jgi:hypothetical protein
MQSSNVGTPPQEKPALPIGEEVQAFRVFSAAQRRNSSQDETGKLLAGEDVSGADLVEL